MTLPPGTRIGAFEISDQIGAGGMGEVYRATDTRLGRAVAIKLLPASFTSDSDRISRFQREAELLAALNHANIAQIYGVEPLSGSGDAGSGAMSLIMELIEGETLEQRLREGPLSIEDALSTAVQVAAALEAAHSSGIVHRDLKPANVMLAHNDVVKLLDFGLAAETSIDAADPRVPSNLTQTGMIQGTPGYMAPEQVRGEPVGTQSDVWAFGCLLFEMLSGQPAFTQATAIETIARVLEREPNLDLLSPDCPASVQRLVARCLEKKRRRRLHHIADARIEIEDALGAPQPSAPSVRTGKSRGPAIAAFATGFATAAIGAFAWFASNPSEGIAATPFRFSMRPPALPQVQMAGARYLALSSDGSRLAYVADGQIFEELIGESEPQPVSTGTSPFYRDDGDWLGFVDGQTLKKQPLNGRTPESIAPFDARFLGADWRGDTIVFATSEGLFGVLDEPGSEPELLLASDTEATYAWPQFAEDVTSIILTVIPSDGVGAARTIWYSSEDGSMTPVGRGTGAQYLPGGIVVSAVGQGLEAIRVDTDSHETVGPPIAIPDSSVTIRRPYGDADFSVSDTGTLAVMSISGLGPPALTLVWIDPVTGVEESTNIAPGAMSHPRLSPDGTRVAVDRFLEGEREVWVYDLRDGTGTNISRAAGEDLWPEWGDGGQRLCWSSTRLGGFQIFCRRADGSGPTEHWIDDRRAQLPWSVTDDGRIVVFNGIPDQSDIGIISADEPRRVTWILEDPNASEENGSLSADGNHLLYESNESGEHPQVYISPFPNVTSSRLQVSSGGGNQPRWGPEVDGGRLVYYQSPNGDFWEAEVQLSAPADVRQRRLLFENAGYGFLGESGLVVAYDVSPQDGRFLLTRSAEAQQADVTIDVTLNWDVLLDEALSR
jgi:hypothetical protein